MTEKPGHPRSDIKLSGRAAAKVTMTGVLQLFRKQPKDHGLEKLIEGGVKSSDRALIVDDVLTSGGSLLKAVAAARAAGLVVTHALVIVDRKEQDGRRKVEAEGLTLLSLLTIDDLTRAQPTRS